MSLTITLVQSKLLWEDIDGNLSMFAHKLQKIEQTDVIVLPEMFSTGFTMNVEKVAENMNGKAIKWMHVLAQKHHAVITGSLIIKDEGRYYNRLIWVEPDGKQYAYDKKHLFTMANEHLKFTAGTKKLIIDYKGWRIAPFICYDLRFPVWNRNQENYDLAFYVANWPAKRSYHWLSLLFGRAIENQSYIVAVNRVGKDGNGIIYSGNSTVVDPAGELMYHKENDEEVHTITLTKEHLVEVRNQYPFLGDRDNFSVFDATNN
ncbi:MAG: amidohydrolase [Saprospiraceae bacterium]|nr:amidohydrolase [Saprospiraceae bacterium]